MPGDKGSRYVYSASQISNVLTKIQSLGRPDKLTLTYIQNTWLLRNAQYGAVIDILEDMEFIKAGVPTSYYAKYQNKSFSKTELAEGIKRAYPELFKAYPSAQTLSKDELEGYFKQNTGKAGSVLEKIVSTFKTLCSQADFSPVEIGGTDEVKIINQSSGEITKHPRVKVEPNLQINIELHIASDTPDNKIGVIFENMRRYLLSDE